MTKSIKQFPLNGHFQKICTRIIKMLRRIIVKKIMQNPSKTKHGERALAFLVFHPGFASQELLLSIFFSWDSLHTMLKSHKKPWSYMDKREHKEGKDKGKLIRKCLKTKCAYLLKVIRIINQKKTFYRQRISECSCTRKESFDITGTFLGIPVHISNIYCVSESK